MVDNFLRKWKRKRMNVATWDGGIIICPYHCQQSLRAFCESNYFLATIRKVGIVSLL